MPVSVCVSYKSVLYRNGWTNRAGFRIQVSFDCVIYENSGNSEDKGTSLWNYVSSSGLRKFHHDRPFVAACYPLTCSATKVDA